MLTAEQINSIHRLHWAEHWSVRKIARHLHLARRTISQYLATPARSAARRQRASKLDPFKATIAELLEQDAKASAMVIAQRLRPLGFTGGLSILKDYLHAVRAHTAAKRAYVRMEPGPGERFEIDWGHFGALLYQGHARKLYAFCLVECHSRKLFVEFTHSQSFETFVRCHIHAFQFLGGIARELWFDNLATALAEHEGNFVRLHPRFLGFAPEYSFLPRACHVRAAWEKGKIERAVGYLRQNFWPLRTFTDLTDVNLQARHWLEQVANQRRHRETGETPAASSACDRARLSGYRRSSGPQRSPAVVRWQPLLRAAALCRPSPHDQSRCFRGHHLRPVSGDRFLCPLLAARADFGCGAFSKGTVGPVNRRAALGRTTALGQLAWSGLGILPASPGRYRPLADPASPRTAPPGS